MQHAMMVQQRQDLRKNRLSLVEKELNNSVWGCLVEELMTAGSHRIPFETDLYNGLRKGEH